MPPERHARRALLVALFVALTGPLIGVLAMLTLVLARTVAGLGYDEIKMPNIADVSQVILFFSLFAYVFAGWSAIIAGALLGWRTYTHGTFGYLFAIAVAVAATFIGTATLNFLVDQQGQSFLGMAMFLTPFSIVAAIAGRWILRRIGILPTNASTSLARN